MQNISFTKVCLQSESLKLSPQFVDKVLLFIGIFAQFAQGDKVD